MTVPIVWSQKAEETFDAIVKYLKTNWTVREVDDFIAKTNHRLERIKLLSFFVP